VELAKVSLWLHTFTVGAPLSFLDHHLRCGDSLFGSWVRGGIDKATAQGSPLLLHGPVTRATRAATSMQIIEGLTDAEIAEAHRSADVFDEVREMTAPLDAFLSLVHAFDWLNIRDRDDKAALRAFFDGQFGDPIDIALGKAEIQNRRPEARRFLALFDEARALAAEERFLNWQVAFPGVWSNWDSVDRTGGFDAVIGNPPWDRLEFEEVHWFAARNKEIAYETNGARRKARIRALRDAGDPLWDAYQKAVQRTNTAARIVRHGGDYHLLNVGKLNIRAPLKMPSRVSIG